MKPLLFIHALVLAFSVNAQEGVYTSPEEKFEEFIPKGYHVVDATEGDLNLDEWNDAVVVLAINGEDTLSSQSHPIKRKLLLLLGEENDTYQLGAESEDIVYYYMYDANFRDCYTGTTIKKGTFSVVFYGGFRVRWDRSVTFQYNRKKKDWYLISDERGTFDALEEDETLTTSTVKTTKDFGNVSFEKFSIYNE